MTLSRSLFTKITGVTLSFVLLATASLWGLLGMRHGLRIAHDEYQELDMLRDVSMAAVEARSLLHAHEPHAQALSALDRALNGLDRFIRFQPTAAFEAGPHTEEAVVATSARSELAGLRQALAAPADGVAPIAPAGYEATVDDVLRRLARLADRMDENVARTQDASAVRLRHTVLLMALLSSAGILLTVLISASQYRTVIRPLRRLREGVRRVARGNLKEPLDVDGAIEFAELSADFNRMACELAGLYGDLERKVEAKSRELVRSERLASVGYLAAGVAHEINNPLNIITGHAELSLRQAERMTDPRAAEIREALEIIREEGFRCKTITEKLLSLARTSNRSRETVEIARLAGDVVTLVQGLEQFRGRKVHLDPSPQRPLVWGNDSELKQVLLSLVINGLQAVPAGTGEVVLACHCRGGTVELTVSDNGRGIPPDILDHVFEPFFSHVSPGVERGMGMGLSITHAIIEAHGGRITVESGGHGKGSRFTIHLPIYRLNSEQAA